MKVILILPFLIMTSAFADMLEAPRVRLNLAREELKRRQPRKRRNPYAYERRAKRVRDCARRYPKDSSRQRGCRFGSKLIRKRTLEVSTRLGLNRSEINDFLLNERPRHCLRNTMRSMYEFAEKERINERVKELKEILNAKEIIFALNYLVTPKTLDKESPFVIERSVDLLLIDVEGVELVLESLILNPKDYIATSCDEGVPPDELDRIEELIEEVKEAQEEEIENEKLIRKFSEFDDEQIPPTDRG